MIMELNLSDHQVLGHHSRQGPSPPIAQFGCAAHSRKRPGGSKLLPFTDYGGHCAHWDLQCCRIFSVPFLRSVPRYNPVSAVYRQFLGLHGLVCALTCTVNCGILYRQVCAFPNHVQSTEFTTGGLQSSCRNISRMISGNRMHLSSILFLFLINLQRSQTNFFHIVIMGYCL